MKTSYSDRSTGKDTSGSASKEQRFLKRASKSLSRHDLSVSPQTSDDAKDTLSHEPSAKRARRNEDAVRNDGKVSLSDDDAMRRFSGNFNQDEAVAIAVPSPSGKSVESPLTRSEREAEDEDSSSINDLKKLPAREGKLNLFSKPEDKPNVESMGSTIDLTVIPDTALDRSGVHQAEKSGIDDATSTETKSQAALKSTQDKFIDARKIGLGLDKCATIVFGDNSAPPAPAAKMDRNDDMATKSCLKIIHKLQRQNASMKKTVEQRDGQIVSLQKEVQKYENFTSRLKSYLTYLRTEATGAVATLRKQKKELQGQLIQARESWRKERIENDQLKSQNRILKNHIIFQNRQLKMETTSRQVAAKQLSDQLAINDGLLDRLQRMLGSLSFPPNNASQEGPKKK